MSSALDLSGDPRPADGDARGGRVGVPPVGLHPGVPPPGVGLGLVAADEEEAVVAAGGVLEDGVGHQEAGAQGGGRGDGHQEEEERLVEQHVDGGGSPQWQSRSD